MRYFSLLDFQHMILAFFLGVGLVILFYAAWTGYPDRRWEKGEDEVSDETEQAGDQEDEEIKSGHNPVSPFLIFIYVGAAIWALAYAVFVGILGGPIG